MNKNHAAVALGRKSWEARSKKRKQAIENMKRISALGVAARKAKLDETVETSPTA